jgi:hypothetical protein
MSSSLPLLLFLCVCLIVYALDLANPGDRGSGLSRGYYTLCAVWMGWVVLSMVVGYVSVVLDRVDWGGVYVANVDVELDESGEGVKNSARGVGRLMEVMVLAAQLVVSIMLLFCLVSSHFFFREYCIHQVLFTVMNTISITKP